MVLKGGKKEVDSGGDGEADRREGWEDYLKSESLKKGVLLCFTDKKWHQTVKHCPKFVLQKITL